MQTAHSIAPHAQPTNGWAFPVATQPLAPAAARGAVAGGGGAASAPSTVTRMRWGRVLLVLVGIGLLGFGAWTATARTRGADASTKSSSAAATVSGGGANGGALDIASPPRTSAPASVQSTVRPAAKRNARIGSTRSARRSAITRRTTTSVATGASVGNRAGARRDRATAPRRRVIAGGGFAVASANAAGSTRTAPVRSVELPMTGLSTWIAAVLGALLLGLGICVQVNAVRLGMTAMLYRRGILLRPVECARLAQQQGLPRIRVAVSNVLHRLLEEPAARGEFVTAHIAR